MNIEYLDTKDELTEKGAALIAECMRSAVADRGRFLIALSGGNTPKPVYARLAAPPYGPNLPWKDVHIWFGDERMVPNDNPESNYRMACETLLDHIDIPPWNVHRIAGEVTPEVAAEWYDRDLRQLAGDSVTTPPRFDLMLLGLGPDGHTASLFPGADVLSNTHDWAAAVHLPESSAGAVHAQDRVTMTYPVINASRQIVFLEAGSGKEDALRRVEAGDQSAPAARVIPTDGSLLWMVVKP